MPIDLIDPATARERIGPFEGPIIEAHHAAAASWRKLSKDAELFGPLKVRTHRNWFHDHLRHELDARIVGPGATPTEAIDFYALCIEPDVLLRFKHIGFEGLPQNVRTYQQKRLAKQEYTEEDLESLPLASLAPPTLLTCGHTFHGDEVGRIEIRCDCEGRDPWYYHIYGDEAAAEPTVIEGLPMEQPKPAVVRSKTEKGKESGERQSEVG